MNKPIIKAYAGTMRHIVNGLDVVGDDIAEMARRLKTLPRRGYNARSLESDLGIHGYPGETIQISLAPPSDSNNIIIEHKIGNVTLWTSVDNDIVVRAPFAEEDWRSLPETVRDGYQGGALGKLVDFTTSSIPEIGSCPIKSIYYDSGSRSQLVIYVKAPVTTYLASAVKDLQRP